MNYGFYVSSSGMFSALHRMDTAANNLANVETAGFKPDLAVTMSREAVRPEDNVWSLPSDAMLERLGAGVLMAPTATDFTQGALEITGSPLNVALQGEGFLKVRGDDGQPRYTRDGHLAIDRRGTLVQASTGLAFLDDGNNVIRVSPTSPEKLEIGSDGAVRQGAATLSKLAILKPDDYHALKKAGRSHYTLAAGAVTSTPAGTQLVQNALERSGVDAVAAMLEVSAADRAVTQNGKMISIYDELMSKTVSTFGRLG